MTLDIKRPAILLLGAGGVGKSTLGNILLEQYSNGSKKFSTDDVEENIPKVNRTLEINMDDKEYSIVDTIGIPESSKLSDEIWTELKEVEAKARFGVVAYIFVLEEGNFTQNRLLYLNRLFTNFSASRTIVVFNKVRESLISNEEMEKTFTKEISYYLQRIGNRWITMPNFNLFDNIDSKNIMEGKAKELKNIIKEVEKEAKDWNLKIVGGIVIVCIIVIIIVSIIA